MIKIVRDNDKASLSLCLSTYFSPASVEFQFLLSYLEAVYREDKNY